MKIDLTPSFTKAATRLPPDRALAVMRALDRFRLTPDLPSLKFRPLKGHVDVFIINARRGDRIILRRLGADHFAVVDCGPHDNVYRVWDR